MKLNERPGIEKNEKLHVSYAQLNKLLAELKEKELPEEMVLAINSEIDKINAVSEAEGAALKKQIRKTQSRVLNLVEKELKLVPKNHYRNTWLAVGMAAFGLPLGLAFGISLGNMGLLAVGLPVGMVIGMAVGISLDKKAYEEGKQLDLEIKY